MNINQRIKTIRQSANLTQRKFADMLGLKNGAISKIEKDGSTVTEQNRQLICNKFGISRRWLENGEGTMYDEIQNYKNVFQLLREEYGMTDVEEKILQSYFEIDKERRYVVTDFIKSIANKISITPDANKRLAQIEKDRERINKQLDDEKKAIISSASTLISKEKKA